MKYRRSVCFMLGFSLVTIVGPALGIELSWTQATPDAGFHVRDSAGEFVYDNKMWIMGGWYDSRTTTPLLDVWNSSDGVTWNQVTNKAAWTWGEHPTTLVYNNKMWIMGGYKGGSLPGASSGHEVWNSTNGKDWTQVTSAAPWSARSGATGVVFNGKMWIMGGTQFETSGVPVFNDIWSSGDGQNWTLEKVNAAWSPRAFHQVLVFNDEMWLLGGGKYNGATNTYSLLTNDVWKSSDGVNWTRVTDHAPWGARIWHGATVFNDEMWVIGGAEGRGSASYQNDVWHSRDGVYWELATADSNIWSPRHEMSLYDFQGKLWVVTGGTSAGVVNDVWSASIPAPEPAGMHGAAIGAVGIFLIRFVVRGRVRSIAISCGKILQRKSGQRIQTHFAKWSWVTLALVAFAGCGSDRPEIVPISGRVLIDGKPLAHGRVEFIPLKSRQSHGNLDAEGRFQLTCRDQNDGAVLGSHQVCVNASEVLSDSTPTQTKIKWHAPKKFADASTSGLVQEIDRSQNDLVINLSWEGGQPFVETIRDELDIPLHDRKQEQK